MERLSPDSHNKIHQLEQDNIKTLALMGDGLPVNPAAWALLPGAISEAIHLNKFSSGQETILKENVPTDTKTA